jgi:hypothetical protein
MVGVLVGWRVRVAVGVSEGIGVFVGTGVLVGTSVGSGVSLGNGVGEAAALVSAAEVDSIACALGPQALSNMAIKQHRMRILFIAFIVLSPDIPNYHNSM